MHKRDPVIPVNAFGKSASRSTPSGDVTFEASLTLELTDDDQEDETLHPYHRYLHPCYSSGLTSDKKVKIWSFINLLFSFADVAFTLYHVIVAVGGAKMTEGYYTEFFQLFHGLECDALLKTVLVLNLCLQTIYFVGSVLLACAAFLIEALDTRVHLTNWYMHLCALPLVGILFRIPIGIAGRHACFAHDPMGSFSNAIVVNYWISNACLFVVFMFWAFYMHSVAHLFIHWLKIPPPPSLKKCVISEPELLRETIASISIPRTQPLPKPVG